MSETSKPEAWQRRVHIGLHHDIHFLRYAQRRVFADVPVRLGMQIANVKQRQILPRVGKIWACTPQNRTYRAGGIQRVTLGS